MSTSSLTVEELQRSGKAVIPVWPDAGHILGIGKNAAYAAARAGEIPTLRIGARRIVPVVPLLRLLGIEDNSDPTPVPGASNVPVD